MSSESIITVWFDYTCPHCHVGLQRLDALADELSLTIVRRPYLLRPDAPIVGFIGQDNTEKVEPPARDSQGRRPSLAPPSETTLVEPFSSRSPSTVLAHEATACAREQGKELEFYVEVAKEYWDRGSDLGSIYTLRRSAIRARLDWGAIWARLASQHFRSWVMEEHREAVKSGVSGVPTYVLGGKMYSGDTGLEELRLAVKGSA